MSDVELYYFEDLEVGQVREFSDPYDVTDEEIMEMGNRWGNLNAAPLPLRQLHDGTSHAICLILLGRIRSIVLHG